MLAAVSLKNEKEIEKIAQLFKQVGEQAEGMKHYTQYLMQNKVLKDIDSHVKDMFNKTVIH